MVMAHTVMNWHKPRVKIFGIGPMFYLTQHLDHADLVQAVLQELMHAVLTRQNLCAVAQISDYSKQQLAIATTARGQPDNGKSRMANKAYERT